MTPAPPTPGAEAGRGGGGLGGVLGALPGPAREALLRRPEAALAAVRSLPSARARLYALRMAAAGGGSGGGGGGGGGEGVALTGGLVASWAKPGAGSASGHAAALRALVALGLWARDGPEGGFRVSPAFSAGLRSALEDGADGVSGQGEEESAVDAAAAAAAGAVSGDGEGCWEVLLLGLVEAGAGAEVSEEPAPEGEAGEGSDGSAPRGAPSRRLVSGSCCRTPTRRCGPYYRSTFSLWRRGVRPSRWASSCSWVSETCPGPTASRCAGILFP